MKIGVKEAGKELQIIDVTEKYRTECCKAFTGKDNMVNFVPLNQEGTFCLAVNEAGTMKNLPLNLYIEMANEGYPVHKMVGTIVFVRCKYANPPIWDYEVEDLHTEDIELVKQILDKNYQNELSKRFVDSSRGVKFNYPLFQHK